MKRIIEQTMLCCVLMAMSVETATAAPPQPFEWQTANPDSQGVSPAKLDALQKNLVAHKTAAFLVIRNDKIIYEWYAEGHGPKKLEGTASLAKALVGGMSLAVAIDDGRISLDDAVSKFVPEWRSDPRKSKILVRHLGSHTSGLEDSSVEGIAHPNEPGWKGEFWKRLDPPNDPFTISRDVAPVLFAPGEKLAYSNPGIGMLTYAVTATLRDSPQKDIRTLLRDRVMRPIGAADNEWSCGYGKTYTVDGLPLVGSWGGGSYTPRAAARIGRLVLREGDWDGQRILSPAAVRQVTRSAGLPGDCGMGWWTNAAGRYAGIPKDAYWGAGAGDQLLFVVPSLSLIMVRNGQAIAPLPGELPVKPDDVFTRFHDYRARVLFESLIAAIEPPRKMSAAPYPQSKVIAGIEWAPKETIIRQARGCDNWPLTWADDGHQYGAYGDANGFEPKLPEKLSMGLARIEGGPENFLGVNVRSPSFEQKGEGVKGKKVSGMLMADGVLYALVRNAGNAQLAWSQDRGQAWTWSDWKFTTSFGCPTFLNFGANYSGARDDFVYIYSVDADDAYGGGDRMVLARVPKLRIKEQAAYEYLVRADAQGEATWTSDIGQRGTAFASPGNCYRSGVTYNAGLKRYLWCQVHPTSNHPQGPRFQGGFGIYDAPEPWGPWTTVYYTADWDVGPGETNSFPTKWMSADGQTLHLVFSGDDCFSVRKATLVMATP